MLDAVPDGSLDYVFSSHCLERLADPAAAIELWSKKLKPGGVLFLYLPHPDMELWRAGSPWVPEHKWVPTPERIGDLVMGADLDLRILTRAPDAYWSFRCVAVRST